MTASREPGKFPAWPHEASVKAGPAEIDLEPYKARRVPESQDGSYYRGGTTFAETDNLIAAVEALWERVAELKSNKRAPVQGYSRGIPWSMHLRAYDVYCKKYSSQPALIDLEGRNCRGGFGTKELDEFIPGWRDELSETVQLLQRVEAAEAEVIKLRPDALKFREQQELNARWRSQWEAAEAREVELAAALEDYIDWQQNIQDNPKVGDLTSEALGRLARGYATLSATRPEALARARAVVTELLAIWHLIEGAEFEDISDDDDLVVVTIEAPQARRIRAALDQPAKGDAGK